jgi:nitroreductase
MTGKPRTVLIAAVLAAAFGAFAAVPRSSPGFTDEREGVLTPPGQDTAAPFTSEQEYLFDIIKSRRTVRDFRPDPVPKEHILKILDMARSAPTSGNQQPWKFLVIQDRGKLDLLKGRAVAWFLEDYEKRIKPDPKVLERIRKELPATMAKVLSAPVYVAVLTDSRSSYPPDNRHDGPLAVAMLMIAARALGYGTGFYTTYFPEARMREYLGIPERYNLVCFTPIGVPVEWPPAPPKKPLEEFVVFEKF